MASVEQAELSDKRMKLALITETFPPEVNGVSMTLGRLSEGIRAKGHSVTVVCPRRKNRPSPNSAEPSLIEVPGIPIPRYPELRFGLPAAGRLCRIWKKDRPDIVHVATEGPLGWSALNSATRLGIPSVSSFHTNFHSYGRHYGYGLLKPVVLKWLRHCHNRTLRTFAPSKDLIELLERDGFQNLRLMARGVDTRLFDPARRDPRLRQSWGADAHCPVALYVGRLAPEKNLEMVLQAWREMQKILPGLKLVLVGDGPEMNKIRQSRPDIHLAGMQKGTELASHYASADCFLFASVTETFGNVVTEAMASGLPVLAYDYAAPGRFIKSGTNGFLAPLQNTGAFLDAAQLLARCRPDWPEMGKAARASILPHSWEGVIDSYLEEILPLLGQDTHIRRFP